jgi:hypothetical protein
VNHVRVCLPAPYQLCGDLFRIRRCHDVANDGVSWFQADEAPAPMWHSQSYRIGPLQLCLITHGLLVDMRNCEWMSSPEIEVLSSSALGRNDDVTHSQGDWKLLQQQAHACTIHMMSRSGHYSTRSGIQVSRTYLPVCGHGRQPLIPILHAEHRHRDGDCEPACHFNAGCKTIATETLQPDFVDTPSIKASPQHVNPEKLNSSSKLPTLKVTTSHYTTLH